MHIHFTGILKSFEELNTSARGALATWRGRETRLAIIKTLELALPADRNNVCGVGYITTLCAEILCLTTKDNHKKV